MDFAMVYTIVSVSLQASKQALTQGKKKKGKNVWKTLKAVMLITDCFRYS